LQVLRRNLAAAINEVEFKLLPFGQTFKARTLDGADVDEHVLAAAFLCDETKAFLAVEELDDAFAGANDLRGHTVETAASSAATGTTAPAVTAAATVAITTAAAIAAATTTGATAPAVTAATTAAVTVTAAAIIAKIRRRRKSITAVAERIETVFTESVALVPSAATSSIVTHNSVRTLSHCPFSDAPAVGTAIHARRRWMIDSIAPPTHRSITHKAWLCE
jgi:hypothetical protein